MILTGTVGHAAVLALGWKPRVFGAGLYLAVALLGGILLVALVSRWRRRRPSEQLTPSDQLAQFRSLYEEGVLSQEEFERLRALLGGQIRQSVGVPARPGPAADGRVTPGPPADAVGDPAPPGPPRDGIRPA